MSNGNPIGDNQAPTFPPSQIVESPQKSGDLQGTARLQAAVLVDEHLGAKQTLPDFVVTAGQLTEAERQQIVDQALIVIDHIYVHLRLKRAMHAVDPVQRLKLLRLRLDSYSERAFHDEMISIFTHLRDLHTNYILPEPYRSRVAALPFRIEEFIEGGTRRYVVTEVSPGVTDAKFRRGVIPTHWNGIPIERAIEINGEREAGSNLAARHAQGLEALTVRWMGSSLPPDEEWVVIRYLDGETPLETKFTWQVFQPGTPASGVDPMTATGEVAMHLGVDVKAEIQRRTRKLLFAPESIVAERQMAIDAVAYRTLQMKTPAPVSVLPDVIPVFRNVTTPYGTFAYIRIVTFNVDDTAFLKEFMRIIRLVSQNGLILDLRGNGGGNIFAGERLLQLLTPGAIQPEQFSFLNSTLNLQLCKAVPELHPWAASIAESTELGAVYSNSFPLTPVEACNAIGQKYQGPVVLITDAQCYSTTDIFAAGFQDHGIGVILGTAVSTGAGGANVWTHDSLLSHLSAADSPLRPLPRRCTFRVAFRQSARVGPRAGAPVEDLGVTPDQRHEMTRADVLNGNVDLIIHAAKILSGMGASSLMLAFGEAAAGTDVRVITATTKNVERLDIFVDGRPWFTLDVHDGSTTFRLPLPQKRFQFEVRGYRSGRLAVAVRGSPGDMVAPQTAA